MRANRRNVLIGLGTIVAGGGAALGTGAFSSVEATRDVSIETTGDDSALLTLDLDEELDGGGNQISIEINDLNEDATTTFEGALTVKNNGSEDIGLGIEENPNTITFEYDGTDLSGTYVDLDEGEEKELDIVFETGENVTDTDEEVTLVADTDEHTVSA